MSNEYLCENIEGYEFPEDEIIFEMESQDYNNWLETIGYFTELANTTENAVTMEVAA
jgi:hypothetical protein